jgi:hypothetical protein
MRVANGLRSGDVRRLRHDWLTRDIYSWSPNVTVAPFDANRHVNRDAAKGLGGAAFKVDTGDVRRIRQLIERYNPEILPEELRPAPLAPPPAALSLSNNVVRLRGSGD